MMSLLLGQVKAMKPQEVARTWAEYLSAMMRHLTAAQTGDPEVAKNAEKRIADLIQEVANQTNARFRHHHLRSGGKPVILLQALYLVGSSDCKTACRCLCF